MPNESPSPLRDVLADIERHIATGGWDLPAGLYALVAAGAMTASDPALAAQMGADAVPPDRLIPIEQEALPAGSVADALARITWPADVVGCAYAQEVVALPASVENEDMPDADVARWAQEHPLGRDVRVVVGVLRDGSRQSLLRMRGVRDDGGDEVVFGTDLAPGVADALATSLHD